MRLNFKCLFLLQWDVTGVWLTLWLIWHWGTVEGKTGMLSKILSNFSCPIMKLWAEGTVERVIFSFLSHTVFEYPVGSHPQA